MGIFSFGIIINIWMKYILKRKKEYVFLLKSPVVINILFVGLIIVIVKGFGFFKEMKVGQIFGLSELLDTFLIASLIPGFVNSVFMVSFQNLFIPNYISELRQNTNIKGFQSACFLITLGLVFLLILLSVLVTDLYLEEFYRGHSLIFYNLIRKQFYIIVPCILFWSFSSLLAGLLEIKGSFYFAATYTIFTSIITLIFLILFKKEFGSYVLAYGILCGSFIEFLYLLIVSFIKKTLHLGRPDFHSTNITVLYRQFPSKVGSGFLSGSAGFVNQFFAAQLLVGSIASFNYGLKIPSFLVSILAIAIGNVLLPYFSNMIYDNRAKAFQVLFRSIAYVFLGSFFVVGIFFMLSESLISFLFERGNFTNEDTIIVSQIQQILLLYVPFYISGVILNKFLTSINKNVYIFYVSIFSLVFNLILNYYLSKYYGIIGLATATTLISTVNFFALYLFVFYQRNKELSEIS